MEDMGLILILAIVRRCLGPLRMFGPMSWLTPIGLIASPDCHLPLAAHPPHHTPHLSPTSPTIHPHYICTCHL